MDFVEKRSKCDHLFIHCMHGLSVSFMRDLSVESETQLEVIVRGHKSRALRGGTQFLMINPI